MFPKLFTQSLLQSVSRIFLVYDLAWKVILLYSDFKASNEIEAYTYIYPLPTHSLIGSVRKNALVSHLNLVPVWVTGLCSILSVLCHIDNMPEWGTGLYCFSDDELVENKYPPKLVESLREAHRDIKEDNEQLQVIPDYFWIIHESLEKCDHFIPIVNYWLCQLYHMYVFI